MKGIMCKRLGYAGWGASIAGTFWIVHPGGTWLQVGPLALLAAVGVLIWFMERDRLGGTEAVLLACLALYLGSSATTDPLFAWPRWGDAMVVRWAVLAGILAGAVHWRPRLARQALPAMALLLIGWGALTLLVETRGAPLYNDDHPSFIFRLSVLSESLPRWIPYNPYWNGGGVTTYEAASGTLGPALLLWPLLRLFPAIRVYTPGLALLFLGLVPLAAGLAVRTAGGGRIARWSAAVLAIGPGWMLFRWLLEFGAIGACLAMSFLLPVTGLLARLTAGDRFGYGHAAALLACSLGFLAWPGSWPMALAIVPALLVTAPRWTRGTTLRIVGCGVLILLVAAPLVVSLLTRTDLVRFAAGGALEPAPASWGEGFTRVGASFRETNPLILWLGIVGGIGFLQKNHRALVGALVAGLILMAGWGEQLGGGPGMSRTGLALSFVAILPASLAVERLATRPAVFAALLAALIVSGYSSARFYGNRTEASYRTLSPEVHELADWLRQNTPEQSRILFGGMTVHAYGGGHVAALPLLANRGMLAADYYHFSPRLVEYFCPPREFRRTDDDVHRYLMVYGVSHVVAYDVPSVIRFYRKYPDLYEEVKTFDGPLPKTVFRVRAATGSLFHQNAGEVDAAVNRLRVRVEDASKEAIIACQYAEGMKATAPAEIFPVEREGRLWIGIRPHGESTVDIRYRGWL